MPKIKVTIDTVGRPSWEAEGFTGQSCKDATKSLEDAFLGAAMETEDKEEIHMVDEQNTLHETI